MAIRSSPWSAQPGDLVARPGWRRSVQVLGRFAAPRRGPWFWAALAVLGLAAEVGAFVPLIRSDDSVPMTASQILLRLVGGSFVACGLVAWRRRPDSRAGQLMTAAGFLSLLVPLLAQVHADVAQTTVIAVQEFWTIAFIALLLTILNGGRLESTVDRVLLATFVLPLAVLQWVWLLFLEQDGNVLLLFPQADVANAIDKSQRALFCLACIATGVTIFTRWRAASRPRRRALLPSVAGLWVLLLIAALLVNDLVTGTRSATLEWIAISSTLTVPLVFLFGLLRSRLARGGLTDLFRELRTMRGAELQAALARTMGDPDLVLAHRLAGGGGYARTDGSAVRLPEPGEDRAVAEIHGPDGPVAALIYDASLDDDPELVEAVRAAATISLEHEQLHAESHRRLDELRASRERLVAAGDEERRRLERNLHDGAQQRLVALGMQLRLLERRIRDDPAGAAQLATSAGDELATSLQELRELARGIHPAVLDHGLETALESLASRSPVPATLQYDAPAGLPAPVELAAYFVVSEALANIGKYAQASMASVRVGRADGAAIVEVADDGRGGADTAAGSGLRGLADRVEALDGHLVVTSPPGQGTVVTVELPCAS